jgi:hypothetical protein
MSRYAFDSPEKVILAAINNPKTTTPQEIYETAVRFIDSQPHQKGSGSRRQRRTYRRRYLEWKAKAVELLDSRLGDWK